MAHVTFDRNDNNKTGTKALDSLAWVSLGLMMAGIGLTAAIATMG